MFIETRPNILLSSVGATYKTGHISPLRGSKWGNFIRYKHTASTRLHTPKNRIKFLKLMPMCMSEYAYGILNWLGNCIYQGVCTYFGFHYKNGWIE